MYFSLDRKVPKDQDCKKNPKIILHFATEK